MLGCAVLGCARWCKVVLNVFQRNKRINAVFSFYVFLWTKDGNSKVKMANILHAIDNLFSIITQLNGPKETVK